jgi:hypothetical protein
MFRARTGVRLRRELWRLESSKMLKSMELQMNRPRGSVSVEAVKARTYHRCFVDPSPPVVVVPGASASRSKSLMPSAAFALHLSAAGAAHSAGFPFGTISL